MARSFQVSTSVAANTTVNDIFTVAGINAFFGEASNVTYYANGNAIGLTNALFYDTGVSTVAFVPPGSALSAASTSGKIKTNEDFVGQWAIPAGSKLLANVTNTTGAAVVYNALVIVG